MTSINQYNPSKSAPPISLFSRSHRSLVPQPSGDDLNPLLAQYLPLVRRVCDRFRGCGEPVEDLAVVGLGGLLEAVAGYSPHSGHGFVTFAMPLIVGSILDYFRDRGWAMQIPGQVVAHKAMVDRVLQRFDQSLDRAPTIPEIAEATGLSDEMVLQTMESRLQESF